MQCWYVTLITSLSCYYLIITMLFLSSISVEHQLITVTERYCDLWPSFPCLYFSRFEEAACGPSITRPPDTAA